MKARYKIAVSYGICGLLVIPVHGGKLVLPVHEGIPCQCPEIIKHSFGHDFGV